MSGFSVRRTTFVASADYADNNSSWGEHLGDIAEDISGMLGEISGAYLTYTIPASPIELNSDIRDSAANENLEPLYNKVHNDMDVDDQHSVVVVDSHDIFSGNTLGLGQLPYSVITEPLDGTPAVAITEGGADDKLTIGHEMLHNYNSKHKNKYRYINKTLGGEATIMHGNQGNSDCAGNSPGIVSWNQNFRMSKTEDGCDDDIDSTEKILQDYDNFVLKHSDFR